eukprot:4312507-Ditylum_brightwellii.AAC.1
MGRLNKGHIDFRQVLERFPLLNIKTAIACHVSAKGLQSLNIPTLTKHSLLSASDKVIWDDAYSKEYNGLRDLDTWGMITEKQYHTLRKLYGDVLPSMAIATLKYDENGNPKRAKYRIAALGNLDPYSWTKEECYAPVMSQLELRLLVSQCVNDKRMLKNMN